MEELNEALVILINQATSGIDASVGFLQAEIPDVISELLLWYGVRSGIYFGIGVALSIALLVVNIKAVRWILSEGKEDTSAYSFFIFQIPFQFLWGIPALLLNLTWLQIWIAPKVWLLEYAAGLVL